MENSSFRTASSTQPPTENSGGMFKGPGSSPSSCPAHRCTLLMPPVIFARWPASLISGVWGLGAGLELQMKEICESRKVIFIIITCLVSTGIVVGTRQVSPETSDVAIACTNGAGADRRHAFLPRPRGTGSSALLGEGLVYSQAYLVEFIFLAWIEPTVCRALS